MTNGWGTSSASEGAFGIIGALRRRIFASILTVVGGVVFGILYLAFWATQFAWYQNLAVLLVDAIVVPTIVAGLWIAWGLGFARRAAAMARE